MVVIACQKWKYFRHCQHIAKFMKYNLKNDLDCHMNKTFKRCYCKEAVLENSSLSKIRNFSIIAHIDHGKSTLADRILEICGAISTDDKNKQVLDKLQVERERGITVKAQSATVYHTFDDQEYILNFIDTPGHVDFSYEVSRSLHACQGVILLIDATQGIQAQTMANFYLAFVSDLVIIPVINKIDLKTADVQSCISQICNILEMKESEIIQISAKKGTGIDKVLEAVISRIPSPSGNPEGKFRALLFDSWFENYKGAIVNVAVVDGKISVGDTIVAAHSQKMYEIKEIGILTPELENKKSLECGEVGYIIPGMKTTKEAHIGDTLYKKGSDVDVFPGFRPAKPVIFAGIYALNQNQNGALKNAIERLTLNDSSVSVTVENSSALGHGWRLGFLGLLHMEVFTQRLDQEHDVPVVVTAPSVPYKVKLKATSKKSKSVEEEIMIMNPSEFPDSSKVSEYLEPMVIGTIITPIEYVSDITNLCSDCRGTPEDSVDIGNDRVMLRYKFPLNEIILKFFDDLKRITSGYASFDYEESGFASCELRKLDFFLNGQKVDELSQVVHVSNAREYGKLICNRLKEVIPQQLFKIAIQGAVGSKIIAREDLAAMKKNVLAKCYGGDVSRKMKLLKRQAEGKKRMRLIGKVEVPSDAFVTILKK